MKIALLLLFAAVVAAGTVKELLPNKNCIDGCSCEEDSRLVKVSKCPSPLTLTNESLSMLLERAMILVFDNVVIENIENNAFTRLVYLNVLNFKECHIASIEESAFNVETLETVSFTGTTLEKSPILSTEHLVELIFDNCQLTELPSLKGLPNLELVKVPNNQIHDIDSLAFNYLTELNELDLSNNSLTKLPDNLFENNTDLQTLTLDHNPLEQFQMSTISSLEYISLKSCKLTTFDNSVGKNLDLVTHLYLTGNLISVLPLDAFSKMVSLQLLDLSHNQLIELDDDIFVENIKLDVIDLSHNKFNTLPKFQTADNFRTSRFSCRNCSLKVVDGVFKNMRAIVNLDLSNNQISEIDNVFTEMHVLRILDLSNNLIEVISTDALPKNDSQLAKLDLSNNPLKPIDPVVFSTMDKLIVLDISNSSLEKLWLNHNAILPSVERLLVENSMLSSITLEDMEIMPNLKVINIAEIKLKCDQNLQDLIAWLMEKQIHSSEDGLRTHEALKTSSAESFGNDPKQYWKQLALDSCIHDNVFNYDDDDSIDLDENDSNDIIIDDDGLDALDGSDDDDIIMDRSTVYDEGLNLANASYILSVTSVFILSALVVLTLAVSITLVILRRNKSFNFHNDNLPRLKIPVWPTPGVKKHSGSVYQTLSEDRSGAKTPIINRYEFNQTPAVHSVP